MDGITISRQGPLAPYPRGDGLYPVDIEWLGIDADGPYMSLMGKVPSGERAQLVLDSSGNPYAIGGN